MSSSFCEVSFLFTPLNECFSITVDPEKAVYDIINSIMRYLSEQGKLTDNRTLVLRYEGKDLSPNYLFSSYDYIPGTTIEIHCAIDEGSDDLLDSAISFSCYLANKDIKQIHAILQSEINNPPMLSCYLCQYLASLYSDIITGDIVLQMQDNEDNNFSTIIGIIAHGYGGKDLFLSDVVERTLHVLSCVFRTGSVTSLPQEEQLKFWHSIIYILDSILGTYTDANPKRSCKVPPYISYHDELTAARSFSEEEEKILNQMVEIIVFIFSYFFESPAIHAELEKPYMKDTIDCLFNKYYVFPNITGMLFFNYGRAIHSSMQMNHPLNNTLLSQSFARLILKELGNLTNYSLSNDDEIGIVNADNVQVTFTVSYTYCLTAICSVMSAELEELLIKYNFRDNIMSILETCSYDAHNATVAEADQEHYKTILICFLRLLSVMTYDVSVCKLLTEPDYQTFLTISTSIKHLNTVSNTLEFQVNQFFTHILLYCWNNDSNNPIISYLMSNIFRNLTCCKNICMILCTYNEWYNTFIEVIKKEYDLSLNDHSTFLYENVLFVPRSVKVEGNYDRLIVWLINNFIRCIINISNYEVNFVNIVTQQSFWSSCLLEYLQVIPIPTALGLTTMYFLQLIITSDISFNPKQFQMLLSHIQSGMKDDATDVEELKQRMSQRTQMEYQMQSRQAREMYVKLNIFLKHNQHPNWNQIPCNPIPDNEISFILQTIPLDIHSIHYWFNYINEEFVYSVVKVASTSQEPLSYIMYLPLDTTMEHVTRYLGDLAIQDINMNSHPAKPSDTIRQLIDENVAEIHLYTAEAYQMGIELPLSDVPYPTIGNPSILESFKPLLKLSIESDPVELCNQTKNSETESSNQLMEDSVIFSTSRIENRQQRVTSDTCDTRRESILSEGEDVSQLPSFNTITRTINGYDTIINTLTHFVRVVTRDPSIHPTIRVKTIEENKAQSRMRIKRMLKKLKNDPLLERHSLIIVDDAKKGLNHIWYVLQTIASDISDLTIYDYELVLQGCINVLPDLLKERFFEEVSEDLFLVFRYVFELCAYNSVLSMLLNTEGVAFISSLIEFHRLCCYASDHDYMKQCVDYILGILEHVVHDETMLFQALESHGLDLFFNILQHRVITLQEYAQNFVMYIALLRQFQKVANGEEMEPIKQEISLVIDSIQDDTCKRRLLRVVQ